MGRHWLKVMAYKCQMAHGKQMPQCICCVQVNRSPKYTTDRLETKLHTTFEAACLHSKQTIIKKLLHTGTKKPQCICCVQVNRSPKYTTDRLETKQYSQLSKQLAYTRNKQSLKVTSHRHINVPVRLLCTGKQVTQVHNR